MRRPIRFGVQTWSQGTTIDELVTTWRLIDQLKFDTAWVSDHLMPVRAKPGTGCFEAWVLLSALSRETKHVHLGVLVSGNTYRHPAVLAKMAATVDHLSGGRLILGLGAAWFGLEHYAYGIPFFTTAERIRRLDEAAEIIKSLWQKQRTTFQGNYYRLQNAFCEPKPLQKPGPPLLIGASGEKLALRVVARRADIWNSTGSERLFARKIEILRHHCADVGRNFDDIEISWTGFAAVTSSKSEEAVWLKNLSVLTGQTPEEIKESSFIGSAIDVELAIRRFVELGVNHFIIAVVSPFDRDILVQFSKIAERFR